MTYRMRTLSVALLLLVASPLLGTPTVASAGITPHYVGYCPPMPPWMWNKVACRAPHPRVHTPHQGGEVS